MECRNYFTLGFGYLLQHLGRLPGETVDMEEYLNFK